MGIGNSSAPCETQSLYLGLPPQYVHHAKPQEGLDARHQTGDSLHYKNLDTRIELGETDTWIKAGEETNLLMLWELQVDILLYPKSTNILMPYPVAGNSLVLGGMCREEKREVTSYLL